MKKLTLAITAILLVTASFAADILTLKNEMIFEGRVLKITNCEVTFKAMDGNKYLIPAEDIFCVVFENPSDKVYTAYLQLADSEPGLKCLKGKMDAYNYHGKAGLHITLGFLFGPIALIGATVSTPTPQKGRNTYSMSQNKEMFQDPEYLNCYKKKARNKNIRNTGIGYLIRWGALIPLILYFGGE
jgi:hypothetical protein